MPVIEVEGLSKRFGDVEAVRGVTFAVEEGEIFGFLGPNGAGKSTTIKMLATLLLPSGGRASLAGFDVVRQPHAVRRSIGIVFQDPSLDERLTAEENLRLHAMLYGVPAAVAERRIAEALALVELSDRRRSPVRTFSGGMKRRLEIARGLIHRPRVLFLDEPTLGLDPQTRARIWEYVHDLRRREGVTVFMTTHYMEEAEHCDRIAIIDHGLIVALDEPAALKRRVGGDVITLGTRDPASLARGLRERFGVDARVVDGPPGAGAVMLQARDGPELVPRIAAAFPELVRSIAVRQPTLEDVFLALTGRAIRDEEASAVDRMRLHHRLWTRR